MKTFQIVGLVLVIGFSILPQQSIAQYGGSSTSVGLSLGYIGSNRFGGAEASLTWTDVGFGCVGYAGKTLHAGVEFFPAANNHNAIWGEKIGGRVMFNTIYLGLSQQLFFLDEARDHRMMPEIGFDAVTWGNIGYGYSMHLAGSRIRDVAPHRLCVRINLRKIYKETNPRLVPSRSEATGSDW